MQIEPLDFVRTIAHARPTPPKMPMAKQGTARFSRFDAALLGWAIGAFVGMMVGMYVTYDWMSERTVQAQAQWEMFAKCDVSGGRVRYALGKKGEVDLQVAGCSWTSE